MTIEKWTFDLAHSSINFSVRHLMVSKVRGRFTKWSGFVEFDGTRLDASRTEVDIDAASVDTKDVQRDGHLCSQDFLDVEKHPKVTFQSTGVEKAGDKQYRVKGDLTIHGTTRPVVLAVEYGGRVTDPWGGERSGFTASTSIDRKDFGLVWNQALDAGGVVVGDQVEIDIEIEAVKSKVAPVNT